MCGAERLRGGGTEIKSMHEHVPEKPDGNDERDDVFPADAGQDSAARPR